MFLFYQRDPSDIRPLATDTFPLLLVTNHSRTSLNRRSEHHFLQSRNLLDNERKRSEDLRPVAYNQSRLPRQCIHISRLPS